MCEFTFSLSLQSNSQILFKSKLFTFLHIFFSLVCVFSAYLNSLCNESIETAVSQLLNHLPFLTPGSNEAKAEYLSLIPKILTHSVEKGLHLEDSRQLLSYLLIHPALTNEERSSLAWWLGRLEEQTSAGPYGSKQSFADQSPVPSPFPGDGLLGRNGKQNGWRTAVQHKSSRDSGFNDSNSTLNQLSTGSALPHQPLTYTLSAPPAVNVTGPSNDPIGKVVASCIIFLSTLYPTLRMDVSSAFFMSSRTKKTQALLSVCRKLCALQLKC